MAAFLSELLPRYLDPAILWRPIDYGSKWQMLRVLPNRLRGYANYGPAYRPRVLVLIDRDEYNCLALKATLESHTAQCGLTSIRQRAIGGDFDVVNRIVIEELEAWFFGDFAALEAGWPGMGRRANKASYRDPDAIVGGTHEALFRALKSAGHLSGLDRLPKIETARQMGRLMVPDQNRSHSFRQFWAGLSALAIAA